MQVRSVTEVTQYIKLLLDSDQQLADLWVSGEVSNFSRASSGHCYLTLRDAQCELRCVIWRPVAARLGRLPQQGEWIQAHGYVSVYERGGAYQFYVDILERGGVGALWQEFERLKLVLEQEGLFDEARKRPVPRWPRRIGVVTSPSGAALQDILRVLRARYPLVEVVVSPSLVQGSDAPDLLVGAIRRLDELSDIDVVIVARGGGSLEDLWAFNDERVARAIVASRVPVITGVGHETDFTIADFVADLRAPTPTAAATAAVPDVADLRARLREWASQLVAHAHQRVVGLRAQVQREARALALHQPARAMAESRQRVDDLVRRQSVALEHVLTLCRRTLRALGDRLRALGPQAVLGRGYALVQDRATAHLISSVTQVVLDQRLAIHLRDGQVGARVTEVV